MTSPSGLIVLFLMLGTVAMAQRPALHEWLTAFLRQIGESSGPIPRATPPDPTAADLDGLIALGVFAVTVMYWALASALLFELDELLHEEASKRRHGRRR